MAAAHPMASYRPPSSGFIAIGSIKGTSFSSTSKLSDSSSHTLAEADLCCLEDEAWEKEVDTQSSPNTTSAVSYASYSRREQTSNARARASPLRRARTRATTSAGCTWEGLQREERVDVLMKMLTAQAKFHPRVEEQKGGKANGVMRARCHEVSPFVAERRKWFVAWKNKMASFLGYSRDTVAVALNYFDRYTCAEPCSPTLAQAVAATALHVAAKFEESKPASLRDLLKFTPVFTPDQLLAMEMSMLKVLNWDLRPATIFDFVGAFCDLLPAEGHPPVARGRGEDGDRRQELRAGAEEIADLSACEINVLEFLPSTLAISAILLSASRPEALTSHEDVLNALTAVIGMSELIPLERVSDCTRVLGASLAKRYPAAAMAADRANYHVARYLGLEEEVEADVARDLAAVQTSNIHVGSARLTKVVESNRTVTPVSHSKKRRCSTPTSVDGIMLIEMAAVRDGRTVVYVATGDNNCATAAGSKSNSSPSSLSPTAACATMTAAASQPLPENQLRLTTSSGGRNGDAGGNGEGTRAKRPRPILTTATSSPSATGAHASSFSHDNMSVFSVESSAPASSSTAFAPVQGNPKNITQHLWQNSRSATLPTADVASSEADGRQRSTEALGHCARESHFGTPVPWGVSKVKSSAAGATVLGGCGRATA